MKKYIILVTAFMTSLIITLSNFVVAMPITEQPIAPICANITKVVSIKDSEPIEATLRGMPSQVQNRLVARPVAEEWDLIDPRQANSHTIVITFAQFIGNDASELLKNSLISQLANLAVEATFDYREFDNNSELTMNLFGVLQTNPVLSVAVPSDCPASLIHLQLSSQIDLTDPNSYDKDSKGRPVDSDGKLLFLDENGKVVLSNGNAQTVIDAYKSNPIAIIDLINQAAQKSSNALTAQEKQFDLNGDGKVDSNDLYLLKRQAK